MQMETWKTFLFAKTQNVQEFFYRPWKPQQEQAEIEVICESAGRNIQTKLQVEEPNLEKLGKPTNQVPLEQLANLSAGLSVNYQDAEKLITALSLIPEPKPNIRIHSLRSNLYWGGFLFLLLAIYWTGRKFFGMV